MLGQVVSKFASQRSPKFAPKQPSWTLGLKCWPVTVTFSEGGQFEERVGCAPSWARRCGTSARAAGASRGRSFAVPPPWSLLPRLGLASQPVHPVLCSFPRRSAWISQLLLFACISWSISLRGSDTRWLKAQARLCSAGSCQRSFTLSGGLPYSNFRLTAKHGDVFESVVDSDTARPPWQSACSRVRGFEPLEKEERGHWWN